jgi:hypothetical protein
LPQDGTPTVRSDMSKINQIQNRLLELGDGAFQKLADATPL